MVTEQIEARGVKDPATLERDAHGAAPRVRAAPRPRRDAYGDHPLPIGHGQTISQPYIVAFMTEALGLPKGATVLEVGTGSGYQAAVLAQIADARLLGRDPARAGGGGARPPGPPRLPATCRCAWATATRAGRRPGPSTAIIVTAAAPRVPEPLKAQLKDGGRLVIPVGDESQELMVVTRRGDTFEERRILPVRFVPMTGKVRQ